MGLNTILSTSIRLKFLITDCTCVEKKYQRLASKEDNKNNIQKEEKIGKLRNNEFI